MASSCRRLAFDRASALGQALHSTGMEDPVTKFEGDLVVVFVGFALTVVLGGVLGVIFDRAKRRREMDLSARAELQHLYGEWFATWKAWQIVPTLPSTPEDTAKKRELQQKA